MLSTSIDRKSIKLFRKNTEKFGKKSSGSQKSKFKLFQRFRINLNSVIRIKIFRKINKNYAGGDFDFVIFTKSKPP